MFEKPEVLFIPLTTAHIRRLVDSERDLESEISSYSIAEAAAVFTVQKLCSNDMRHRTLQLIERQLAEIIKTGVGLLDAKSEEDLQTLVARRFDPLLFKEGVGLLVSCNIRLIDSDALSGQGYLLESGQWDFSFRTRYAQTLNPVTEAFAMPSGATIRLTSQQSRAYADFLSNPEDHLHIQALAGTGKTHMIGGMIEALANYQPLVLAFTWAQLKPLLDRAGQKKVCGMTYSQLADGLLRFTHGESLVRRAYRSRQEHQVSYENVAKRLKFLPVGRLGSTMVALICTSMVKRFCHGRDNAVTARHIPPQRFTFSKPEEEVLVQYATRLWEQTTVPTDPTHELPLRGFHLVKKLSLLKHITLSARYTHIIIDESHDLTPPLIQFLDRCDQQVITLGDPCQRLDGWAPCRGKHVRYREISHSVRAGRQIEAVVNPLINSNPFVHVPLLEGSRGHDSQVVYYDKTEIPDGCTTILVNSEWGLFEWFQRLGNENVKFDILAQSRKGFKRFAIECINFYHRAGNHPVHGALFHYDDWSDLQYTMQNDPSFKLIDRMLQRGYKLADFEASWAKLEKADRPIIRLGKVFDAKNLELDSVMLAPDLFYDDRATDRKSAARAFAALYIGSTRTRFKLIVPGYMKDWISDHSNWAKSHL
ncbi:helicase [Pseudomonas sp. Pseusp122]|uniref:helicase n=1 Tax=unclassified Pseudomonas TaxID=196821 RepID=UPI0039A6E6A9